MKTKGDNFFKVLIIIGTVIFMLFWLFAFAFYFRVGKQEELLVDWYNEYEEITDFHDVLDAANPIVELPKTYDMAKGNYNVLEAKLPDDISKYNSIDFYNSTDADVYINGELRYSYVDEAKNDYIGGLKKYHTFIMLQDGDEGGTIRIVTRERVEGNITISRVYIGTRLALFYRIFDSNMMFFVLSVSLVVLGTLALIIGIILKLTKKTESPIIAAGTATLLMALWLVINSELFQFLFHNIYLSGIMSNMMLLIMGYPIIAYINGMQRGRYKRFYITVALICEIMTIVIGVVHVTQNVGYRNEVTEVLLIDLVQIAACFLGILTDLFRKKIKEYVLSFIGTSILLVYCVIEFVLYIYIDDRHSGTGVMIGTYLWLGFAIIEQLLAIRRAKDAERAALDASEAKSNFLANMSHEIRTPMNAILGMDEMIIREANGNEKVIKYASDIKSAGNMLLSIINDILDLSKIESGKAELIIDDFDIASVINDVNNITRSRASDKGLSYHINVSPDVPKGFTGDEVRIRQIMLNIINNAIKYTNEGYVLTDISFEPLQDKTGNLIVDVKDTGIGIKKEDIKGMFESFSRLETTRNRNIEGTGLGLTITTNYLKMMGGELKVDSEYGKGSVFTIIIPLPEWNEEPIGEWSKEIENVAVKPTYIPSLMAPQARLLVVDDNEMNLDVVTGLLKGSRVHVDTALSGEDAIALADKKQYDLIMLDQMMPGMDGTTTMNKMRDKGIDKPIIALTADAGDKPKYIKEGFDGFLPKPVDGEELERTLTQFLPENLLLSKEEIRQYIEEEKEKVVVDSNPIEKKKVLVVDADPEVLKEARSDMEGPFTGAYVKTMEKAEKYLSKHEVDYVIVKNIAIVENVEKG